MYFLYTVNLFQLFIDSLLQFAGVFHSFKFLVFQCANMAGVSAALVLSGESTREEMQNSQYLVEYVYPSVKEMYAEWVYGQKKKCS